MRDREFCSAAHRKSYGARLGRALEDLAAPEPPPAAVAGFRIDTPLQSGNLSRSVAVWEFGRCGSAIEWRDAWPLSIGGVRGQGAKALTRSHWAPFASGLCAQSREGPSVYCPDIQFPRFELAVEDNMPLGGGEVAESPPLAGAAFWDIPEANEAAYIMATPEVARRTAPILEPAAMAMMAAPLVIGIRGLVAAPGAEAAEALFRPAPYAAAMAFPNAVGTGSAWTLEQTGKLSLALQGCGAAAAPAAEAVETLFRPAPYAGDVAFPAAAAMVSAWVPEPVSEVSLAFDRCGVMAAPAAEVVEALLPPAPYADAAAFPAAAAAATGVPWTLEPAGVPSLILEGCGAMAAPAPAAAETLLPAAPMASAVAFACAAVRLPELALAAVPEADTETAENVSEPVEVVPPSESWMAPPPACEVEREVWPVEAAALPLEAAVQVPGAAALAIAEPMMRESAGRRLAPLAEPVVAYVSARLAGSIGEAALRPAAYCVPDLAGLGIAGRRPSAARQRIPNPASPERASCLAAEPAAAAGAGAIQLPGLVLAHTTGGPAGAFRVS